MEIPESDRKLIENLSLSDNLAFAIALDDNPRCAEYIISTILCRDDIRIKDVHTQLHKERTGKSIIYDLHARDKKGNVYVCEMQKVLISSKEIMARASYYEAMLAGETLRKGMKRYSDMKERTVIFITFNDAGGRGKAICNYSYMEEEKYYMPNTKSKLVMANAMFDGKMEEGFRVFSADIVEKDLGRIVTPVLKEALMRVKGSEKEMIQTYGMIEEIKAKAAASARKESFREGEKKGINKVAVNMLKANFTFSDISISTGLSMDAIQKIADSIKQ